MVARTKPTQNRAKLGEIYTTERFIGLEKTFE